MSVAGFAPLLPIFQTLADCARYRRSGLVRLPIFLAPSAQWLYPMIAIVIRRCPLTLNAETAATMKLSTKIQALPKLAAARFLNRPTPLVVGWSLGTQCVFSCTYCNVWRKNQPGLPTETALRLIDDMAATGVKVIQFTGGEPLLRKDLGQLIDRCYVRGISVSLSTTGYGVADRIHELKNLGQFSISLDGPRDVHDALRGDGAYACALEGLEAAKRLDKKIRISTVLSSENLDSLSHVLEVAHRYHARVMFQPATETLLQGEQPNPVLAAPARISAALDFLIAEKRRGNPHIGNSLAGLRYLRRFPELAPMRCYASRIACRLTPDGIMKGCPRMPDQADGPDCTQMPFSEAFKRLERRESCPGCWVSARLELNMILAPSPVAAWNARST